MDEVRITALDLSLTSTGWAGGAGASAETGRIKVRTRGMARIDEILTAVRDVTHYADVVVLEGYSFGSKAKGEYLGELGGVIRYHLFKRGVPYVEVPPSRLKKFATGKGNAGKDEVLAAAIRRYGFEGEGNDEADAWLLFCMADHAYNLGTEGLTVPAVEAVDAIVWPKLVTRL